MIEINLLPKEYLKSSRSLSLGKTGLYAIVAVAGIVLMLVGITFYQMYQLGQLESDIEKARARAAVLQKDIQVVDALMEVKAKISDRMSAVERLDRNRSAWVRVLEDMARNVPEFVWLGIFREKEIVVAQKNESANKNAGGKDANAESTPVKSDGPPSSREVEIEGYAFTLNSLAAFMINLMRSDYFDEVELVRSEEKKFPEKESAYLFQLSANVHYLSDEELRNMIAQAEQEANKEANASHRALN